MQTEDSISTRIAEEILSHVEDGEFERAKMAGGVDEKCGEVGMILVRAAKESNLKVYHDMIYWYDSEKGYWTPTSADGDAMKSAANICVMSAGLPAVGYMKRGSRLENMINTSTIYPPLTPNKSLVPFKNCVLNLDTEESEMKRADHNLMFSLPYDYNKDATCPLWLSTLTKILPDIGSRMVLQEFLGAVFLDRDKYKLEKMLFLLGRGSNGKSVIYETVINLFGRNNISYFDISALASGDERLAQYNIASVDGKLLNYCSDSSDGEIANQKIKGIISGEAQMGRFPSGRPFEVRNIPILMANVNRMPATSDQSDGFYRRIMIMPFLIQIKEEEQDIELHVKLRSEYAGILNWILDGRSRYLAQDCKFSLSEVMQRAWMSYKVGSNNVAAFMQAKNYCSSAIIINDKPDLVLASDLYREYKDYCLINGMKCTSSTTFGEKLAIWGLEKRRRAGGYYYDIYTIPDAEHFMRAEANGMTTMNLSGYQTVAGMVVDAELEEARRLEANRYLMAEVAGKVLRLEEKEGKAVQQQIDYDPLNGGLHEEAEEEVVKIEEIEEGSNNEEDNENICPL